MLMRMRNSQYFSWWTAINTAAYQGKSMTNITSFFGITMLQYSLARKLKGITSQATVMEKCRHTLIESGKNGVTAVDNSQFPTPRKHQRQGISSTMNMYSFRSFFKAKQVEEDIKLLRTYTRPNITYLDQEIPPAIGMPAYHLYPNINAYTFEPPSLPPYINFFNHSSGACMDAYAKRFELSQIISSFRRLVPHEKREKEFKFQQEDDVNAFIQSRYSKLLDRNRRKNGNRFSFYKLMGEFPHRATVRWRGESEKAEILIQPLSKMDETTNKGAGVIMITQLVMFGILKVTGNEGTSGNLNDLELEEDWEKRSLMFVGDGLTMARIKSFDELLNKSCHGHEQRYQKTLMLRKAMSRVVMVTGDLHGCFHSLMAIYSIFYGSLIQPIQVLLKWKRIKGSDITTCYQQAAGLTILLLDEIERHLIPKSTRALDEDLLAKGQFNSIQNDEKEVAIFLSTYYRRWLKCKLKTTTDDVFRMAISFVILMHMYKNLVIAVRSGDSMMIEYLYIKLLPVFESSSKRNYVEIACSMVDTLYTSIDPHILHFVRLNRTFPLYAGRDKPGGVLMAHKAIDDHVESQQPALAALGTNPENRNEFCDASVHVTFYKKARQFSQIQYYRNETKTKKLNKQTDEVAANKQKSVKPKRSLEKMAIAEYLMLTSATKEIDHRKYSRKEFWDALSKTTVDLKAPNQNANRDSDDNVGVDKVAAELYGTVSGSTDDSNEIGINSAGNDCDVELPNGFYGTGEDHDEDEDEEENVRHNNEQHDEANEDSLCADSNEVEIRTGPGKRKERVRRMAVNVLCFKDIIAEGTRKLELKDLPIVRHRKFLRRERKKEIDSNVYEYYKSSCEDGDEDEGTRFEMAKLKRTLHN